MFIHRCDTIITNIDNKIQAYRLSISVTTPFGVMSTVFPQNLILGCTAPWKTNKSDSTWNALTGGWWLTCSQMIRMPRSGLQQTLNNIKHKQI